MPFHSIKQTTPKVPAIVVTTDPEEPLLSRKPILIQDICPECRKIVGPFIHPYEVGLTARGVNKIYQGIRYCPPCRPPERARWVGDPSAKDRKGCPFCKIWFGIKAWLNGDIE